MADFLDHRTAAHVQNYGRGLHQIELALADQAGCLGRQRRGYRDVVAFRQHGVKIGGGVDTVHMLVSGARRRIPAQRQHAHAERFRARRHGSPDIPVRDDSDGLFADLHVVEHIPAMLGFGLHPAGNVLGEIKNSRA